MVKHLDPLDLRLEWDTHTTVRMLTSDSRTLIFREEVRTPTRFSPVYTD